MGRFFIRRLWPALLVLCLLCSCGSSQTAYDRQFVAMDTYLHLTAYGSGAETALSRANEEIIRLETLLDVTSEKSEVYAINHRTAGTLTLSDELEQLLSLSLELARETDGAFNPAVYPVVSCWGFTTGSYRVPAGAELDALLPLTDYTNAQLNGRQLTLQSGMQLDFGGIAKGWAGDRVLAMWKEAGLTSGILRLGGNIQTLGAKPDGSAWKVGIQDPKTEQPLAAVAVTDKAVITSGSYQRYFTASGQVYHHIIDPATGSPARSGLESVTVVGDSGARCDALSTALFVMGLENAAQFWRDHRDFEAVFILEDGSISITSGLKGSFALMDGFADRTVEVLS